MLYLKELNSNKSRLQRKHKFALENRYGYVVALFATLMQGLDPNERMYNERMESIMCYMRHRNFPQKLFRQVTRYYTHFFKYKTALDENSILEDLSFNLQHEVGEFLAQKLFVKTYLFSKFPFQLLIQLLGKLMPIKNGPDEVVFRMGQTGKHMYIVSIGDVFAFDASGRVFFDFKPGAVFGEYTALGLLGGRLFHTQCRTMVEMCTLTADDMEDVFGCVPHAMRDIVKRAKSALNMTVKKFKLQKRARMLKQLTKPKRHKSSIVEDTSIGRDSSMGDISVATQVEEGEEEEVEVKTEEEERETNTDEFEGIFASNDDRITLKNDNDASSKIDAVTSTSEVQKIKVNDNSELLLHSIRDIIQAELQPLRRDLQKLKKRFRKRSAVVYDEEESNSSSTSRFASNSGTGLHQRARRNSLLQT